MKQIPFRIVALEVESFKLTTNKLLQEMPVEVRTSYRFGVNIESHVIAACVTYQYLQGDAELLEMVLTSSFDVKQQEFNEMIEDDKLTLEPYFSQYLATINVGAARGEIHARCEQEKSELANIILPPINLVEALPNPIVIDI